MAASTGWPFARRSIRFEMMLPSFPSARGLGNMNDALLIAAGRFIPHGVGAVHSPDRHPPICERGDDELSVILLIFKTAHRNPMAHYKTIFNKASLHAHECRVRGRVGGL